MVELTAKERWEQSMFRAFAKCSDLNIVPSSIYSCKPPVPDIRCMENGTGYYFELAEVMPQVQAQALSTKGIYLARWIFWARAR